VSSTVHTNHTKSRILLQNTRSVQEVKYVQVENMTKHNLPLRNASYM